ncbi:hypothetical protein [Salinimicrobium terrae]|uniref:hypothetical protein n=1 Tax=Salinimicrobium terrae TaxID=470866 RepID=UPI0003FDE3C8|nr:hypothetical protein [Salinimicrobium terrae]
MAPTKLHQKLFTEALVWRMLTGALIGFVFITFFVIGVDNPDHEWPEYWKARPMIVVPITGAIAGAFFDFMHLLRRQGGALKLLGIILSLFGCLIILWLGSVYGLAGTLWD